MRTMLAILALLAAGTTAAFAGSASAYPVSYDYPWCVMGGELGYSGDCSYQTSGEPPGLLNPPVARGAP
jgi:hypothetical protein